MNLITAVVTGGSIMERLRLKPIIRLVYYEICRKVNSEYGWETICEKPIELTNASLAMALSSGQQAGGYSAQIGYAMKALRAAGLINYTQTRRRIGRGYSLVLCDLQRYNGMCVNANKKTKLSNMSSSVDTTVTTDNDVFVDDNMQFSVLEVQDALYDKFEELDASIIDTAIQLAIERLLNRGKPVKSSAVIAVATAALERVN